MGQIRIQIAGSFTEKNGITEFSAMSHGHAHAVREAIEFLSREVLPFAINKDHTLHEQRQFPENGFLA